MRKIFILICMGTSLLAPFPMGHASDWPMFGNHPSNDLNQAESSTLSPGNASKLKPLWSTKVLGPMFKTLVVDASGAYLTTNSHAYRLDKTTGAVQWEKSIDQLTRECPAQAGNELPPDSSAVFLTETSPAIAGDLLIIPTLAAADTYSELNPTHAGGGFILITDKNGECLHRIRLSEHPFEGILGSPTVHHGIAYVGISGYEEQAASFPGYQCCTTIGKVCAVDIDNGVKKWCTNLIDADPSTPERDITAMVGNQLVDVTGISGITVWSSAPAVDEKNNQVIVTTGNAYTINPDIDPSVFPRRPYLSTPSSQSTLIPASSRMLIAWCLTIFGMSIAWCKAPAIASSSRSDQTMISVQAQTSSTSTAPISRWRSISLARSMRWTRTPYRCFGKNRWSVDIAWLGRQRQRRTVDLCQQSGLLRHRL